MPVIFTGLNTNTLFKQKTQKSELLKSHGDKAVLLSSANTYSYDKFKVNFSTYVATMMHTQNITALGNETYYFFGDHNRTEWKVRVYMDIYYM